MSRRHAHTGEVRVGDTVVPPGETAELELKVARLFTGDWMSLPVAVYHGARPGPRLWLSAALHGDELNGVEVIRQVIRGLDAQRLAGVVIAVPVVNVFGFLERDRYLPDRRDLNRSFPGSKQGSLAARLAHLFMTEVVERCDYGLDFHTGSLHRSNLPQIRAHLDDPETRRLAVAFGAPMIYQAPLISGSLRAASKKLGVRNLLFEGGEPMRFDDDVIEAGVRGTRRVLDALGMWPNGTDKASEPIFVGSTTSWVRAARSGIFRLKVKLGERVERGQILGRIGSDFFSDKSRHVKAPFGGLVIGSTQNPLVNQGDALIHLAKGEDLHPASP